MEVQQAKRIAMNKFEILGRDGSIQSTLAMHRGVWVAEGAALSGVFGGSKISDRPCINVIGVDYEVHRRLKSNKFMLNDFEVSLRRKYDPDGTNLAVAFVPGRKRSTQITYFERSYVLQHRSLFSFKHDLTVDGESIAKFTEDTPFLTFSTYRSIAIAMPHGAIDPVLLAFTFFLAVCASNSN